MTLTKYLIDNTDDASMKVDLQGTDETTSLQLVNEVAVLEIPPDESTGETQATAMDMKFISETISIRGTLKDGMGDHNILAPTTKHEKIWALFTLEILPCKFYWGSSSPRTFYVKITRYTMTQLPGHIDVEYDLVLRIVKNES